MRHARNVGFHTRDINCACAKTRVVVGPGVGIRSHYGHGRIRFGADSRRGSCIRSGRNGGLFRSPNGNIGARRPKNVAIPLHVKKHGPVKKRPVTSTSRHGRLSYIIWLKPSRKPFSTMRAKSKTLPMWERGNVENSRKPFSGNSGIRDLELVLKSTTSPKHRSRPFSISGVKHQSQTHRPR